VTRTIFNERDQFSGWLVVRVGSKSVYQFANIVHDLQVGTLAIAANVVDLARRALVQNTPDRFAVIFNIEPVSHVQSVTVNRLISGISFSGN